MTGKDIIPALNGEVPTYVSFYDENKGLKYGATSAPWTPTDANMDSAGWTLSSTGTILNGHVPHQPAPPASSSSESGAAAPQAC